ncbi:hypothetical protein V5799_018627 [Amblyomma americanum]|uniref:Uncharacterized protein n=1 Tax=Amblyomma americanum TaxID=6943 RepID=A0AAQ4EZ88_AMBAM
MTNRANRIKVAVLGGPRSGKSVCCSRVICCEFPGNSLVANNCRLLCGNIRDCRLHDNGSVTLFLPNITNGSFIDEDLGCKRHVGTTVGDLLNGSSSRAVPQYWSVRLPDERALIKVGPTTGKRGDVATVRCRLSRPDWRFTPSTRKIPRKQKKTVLYDFMFLKPLSSAGWAVS